MKRKPTERASTTERRSMSARRYFFLLLLDGEIQYYLNIIPIIKKEFTKVIKQKHLQSDTNTKQNIDDIKKDFDLSATNPNSTNIIGDGVGKTALIINKAS